MADKNLATQTSVGVLYAEHHPWLRRWLRGRLGDASQAEDIAHDTFVRLLAGRRALAPQGEPRALLTHIAKGLVVDHWRRRAVEQAYLDALAARPGELAPSPEQRLLILEALCRIEAMLRSLPAKAQQAFLMAQLDGLGYAEIARRLGISVPTVKRHMHRAFLTCLVAAE